MIVQALLYAFNDRREKLPDATTAERQRKGPDMKIDKTVSSFALLVYLALATVTETHPVLMPLFKIGAAISAWHFMSGFLAYLRPTKI